MQTHTVFRPGILSTTQLRKGVVEMSCLQVSINSVIDFPHDMGDALPSIIHESRVILLAETNVFLYCSKPAQLEGLEVDQYMWGILNTANNSDVDEVTIDGGANWKPAKTSANSGIKVTRHSILGIFVNYPISKFYFCILKT